MDKLFKKISKDIESIKSITEMKIIKRNSINASCEYCFDYIVNDDINILCDTEYVRKILNNGEEHYGLSVMGKEYSEIK